MPDFIKYKILQNGICDICGVKTKLAGEDYATKMKVCEEDFEHLGRAHLFLNVCIEKDCGIEHPKRQLGS